MNQQVNTYLNRYIYRENPLIWWDASNEIFMQEGYDKNGVIYSIVNKVAEKVSQVPCYEYIVPDKNRKKQLQAMRSGFDIKSQVQASIILKEEMQEYEGTDNVTKLISQPNEGQTFSDFVQFVLKNKMIYGGCPVVANNGAVDMGKTVGLYAYNPEHVQIKVDANLMVINQAEINLFGASKQIDAKLLYFVKYQNPKLELNGEHLFGFSPLKPGLRPLQVDNANLEAQLFIMKNKGVLGTFMPENMESLEAMQAGITNPDQLRAKMKDLMEYKGQDASVNRPYINAMLKYVSFGMDSEQMGLDASQKAMRETLAMLYDYPVTLLDSRKATDNNFEHSLKYLLTNTTAPHRKSIEDMVNNWLYPLNGITDRLFVMDISDMPEIQSDYSEMADKMKTAGAFSPNEIRETLRWDKSDLPIMDVPMIPGNMVPVTSLEDNGDVNMGDY